MDMKSDNDFANAYIDVNQNNPRAIIWNITMLSNMGLGMSFRVEIVVCGTETLNCDNQVPGGNCPTE